MGKRMPELQNDGYKIMGNEGRKMEGRKISQGNEGQRNGIVMGERHGLQMPRH